MHHLLSHMDLTPIEYIKQRFRHGEDREVADQLLTFTPEEEKRRQDFGEVCRQPVRLLCE